jgi:dihydrofolate reductase
MTLNRPKVTLIAAISVDGFIAPADKEALPSTVWTSKEDWQFFTKKSKEIGTLIMGSKTFETIRRALPERRMIVMTSDPSRYAEFSDPNLEFTSAEPAEILTQLQTAGTKRVALCGGAHIYALFMRLDLVDELILTVEPYVFGEGIKLFSGQVEQQFTLFDQQKINDSGTLVLHYQRVEKA